MLLLPLLLSGPHAWAVAPNPGAPGTLAPDRDWDVEHLHLDLDVDLEGRRIAGSVTLTVRPLLPGDEWLVLDQIDLEIAGVTVDGADVDWRADGDALKIEVGRPEGAVDVTVDYAASPRKGLHWRAPGPDSPDTYLEVWSQGEGEDNRYWIPLPDYPNDRFTSSGRFTVPEGLTALSNGTGGFEDGAWVYTMDQEIVAYLVALAVADYQLREDSWDDVPIQQWYPPDATEEEVASVSQHIPGMMAYFSELTGLDYPYPIYREVFIQRFMYSGMENTTITIEDRKLLHPADERDEHTWPERVAAHELAHQWYGDALTCRTWHELWLNEGFATFFASQWWRHTHDEADWYSDVKRWYAASVNSPPMAGRWWSTPGGDHGANAQVYIRGASVLQMLRVMLGEEAFWAGIQRYTIENQDRLVVTDDLRRAFEEVSGQHLGWFFDQWVHLPGGPSIDAGWSWASSEAGGALTVKLTQPHDPDGGRPLYRAPVDLEVGSADGPVRHRLWLEGPEASWQTELDAPPLYIAVDPDAGLLADWSVDQSPEMWRAQLGSDAPYARLHAIDALGDLRPTEAAIDALIGLFEDQSEPVPIRLAAADALGRFAGISRAGRSLAAALADDPHPRVRYAAAEALAANMGDAGEADALAKAARSDRSDRIRGRAITSLAQHDPDRAVRLASAALRERVDYRADLHEAAARVIGAHGDLADLPTLQERIDPGLPRDLHHAAARGAVVLLAREDPEHRDERRRARTARAIEGMLDNPSYRTRQRGIALLGELYEPDAVRALQAYRSAETVSELRDAADRAIEKIRNGPPDAPDDDAELAARIAELEDRLSALEESAEAE